MGLQFVAEEQVQHPERDQPRERAQRDGLNAVLVKGLYLHTSDCITCLPARGVAASAKHRENSQQDHQAEENRERHGPAGAGIHGQGAPSVSKSPSPATDDGGTSVGSISSSIGGGEVVLVGLGVALGDTLGLAEVAVGVGVGVGDGEGACVVGAAVVSVGEGVTGRVAVGLGVGSGSSGALRDAQSAPPPRPSPMAIRTASTIGHREDRGSSGGISGSCAGGMAMVG